MGDEWSRKGKGYAFVVVVVVVISDIKSHIDVAVVVSNKMIDVIEVVVIEYNVVVGGGGKWLVLHGVVAIVVVVVVERVEGGVGKRGRSDWV